MSFDPTPETEVVTTTEDALLEPLTRAEREEMKALSKQAYGKLYAFQKLLKKGELKEADAKTNNGDPIKVKVVEYFTIQQIKDKMTKIVADNVAALAAEEAKKAEALKANKGPGSDSVPSLVEETKNEPTA